MSMNHPQELFRALKSGYWPLLTGDQREKDLRIAFFQGMHSGFELTKQALMAPGFTEQQRIDTLHDMQIDVTDALHQVGTVPGKVDLGLKPKGPKVRGYIDGQSINGE